MKTLTLIDVPKDSPSRQQKLDALKRALNIETMRSVGWKREDHPWVALHKPSVNRFSAYGGNSSMSIPEAFAKVGLLLEESGVLVTGETERDAIRELCHNIGVPVQL